MSLKRIWTLVKVEILHGPKDIILIMAVVMPVLVALFANLAFGNLFADRPTLGILDQGQSRLPVILNSIDSINLKTYTDEIGIKKATADGSIDMGIVLPDDFDNMVAAGSITLKAYVWGESQAKSRIIIPVVLADAVREMKSSVLPVNIQTVSLGDESSIPWNDRLLPLVVLLAIFFGGMMIPASSLINEKNRHTLEALSVTPTGIGEIFTAKGIIGAILAIIMGILTLVISGAFNSSFWVVILVLGLGAIMAAEIGLLAGALINDINSLFALWKFGGLLLFGPAIVFMFPQIPQWLGYIFPTFYITKPVIDLTVNGLGFSAILLNLSILVMIVIVIGVIVNTVVNRLSTKALKLTG